MINARKHPFLGASAGDKIYLSLVYALCALAFIATVYPFLYILAVSFSDSQAVYKGEVFIFPVGFTLGGCKQVGSLDEVKGRVLPVIRELLQKQG